MKNAIILCSGGLDSVVTAHFAKKKLFYEKIVILFFDYGQKSLKMEEKSARKCAQELGADFKKIKISELGKISDSLINKTGKVRELRREELKNTDGESKNWYVPCRNLIFLTFGPALAESKFIKEKKIYDIFVGFKNEGREAFPDQTKGFLKNVGKIARENCAGKFKIFAPLIEKDKEDIIHLGKNIGVELEKTWSCYVGKKTQCGKCLACMLRKEGFYWANVEDKTRYLK